MQRFFVPPCAPLSLPDTSLYSPGMSLPDTSLYSPGMSLPHPSVSRFLSIRNRSKKKKQPV